MSSNRLTFAEAEFLLKVLKEARKKSEALQQTIKGGEEIEKLDIIIEKIKGLFEL